MGLGQGVRSGCAVVVLLVVVAVIAIAFWGASKPSKDTTNTSGQVAQPQAIDEAKVRELVGDQTSAENRALMASLWSVEESVDAMTDERIVSVSSKAQNAVNTLVGAPRVVPTISVVCMSKQIAIAISAPGAQFDSGTIKLQLRTDSNPAFTVDAKSDGNTVAIGNAAALARKISESRTLKTRIPVIGGTSDITFLAAGLDQHIPVLKGACKL